MTREDVTKNLDIVSKKLADLKDFRANELFIYATKDKYLDGHGFVNELPSMEAIIECQRDILTFEKECLTPAVDENAEAMEMLGLAQEDLSQPTGPAILMGFPVKYWNEDLRTRINELKSDTLFRKLTKAKSLLEANLSDEDKFTRDMSFIDELIG